MSSPRRNDSQLRLHCIFMAAPRAQPYPGVPLRRRGGQPKVASGRAPRTTGRERRRLRGRHAFDAVGRARAPGTTGESGNDCAGPGEGSGLKRCSPVSSRSAEPLGPRRRRRHRRWQRFEPRSTNRRRAATGRRAATRRHRRRWNVATPLARPSTPVPACPSRASNQPASTSRHSHLPLVRSAPDRQRGAFRPRRRRPLLRRRRPALRDRLP
jgi:hypothetical protein